VELRSLHKFASINYVVFGLRQIRRYAGQDVAMQLVSALILSRLDYCNSVLAGLPKSTLVILQRVQNVAARLILELRPRDHTSDALRQLHWLPVDRRIKFKLCVLMHSAHTSRCPNIPEQNIPDTSRFKKRLKTFLFNSAF